MKLDLTGLNSDQLSELLSQRKSISDILAAKLKTFSVRSESQGRELRKAGFWFVADGTAFVAGIIGLRLLVAFL